MNVARFGAATWWLILSVVAFATSWEGLKVLTGVAGSFWIGLSTFGVYWGPDEDWEFSGRRARFMSELPIRPWRLGLASMTIGLVLAAPCIGLVDTHVGIAAFLVGALIGASLGDFFSFLASLAGALASLSVFRLAPSLALEVLACLTLLTFNSSYRSRKRWLSERLVWASLVAVVPLALASLGVYFKNG